MITVSAFKWVPPFAQGQVRDHRVRWVLNEVGWPYRVRLLDAEDQRSDAYRAQQPFGQVPVLTEDGRPPMFESGAIVLDVAMRSGRLLPEQDGDRSLALSWLFAALNSVEPVLSNVAEVAFFLQDDTQKRARLPLVRAAAEQRLGELQRALGDREYLVADRFGVADLMIASVLRIARSLDLLAQFPVLDAWQARICDRPACRDAIAAQCADFARHAPSDMKYPPGVAPPVEADGPGQGPSGSGQVRILSVSIDVPIHRAYAIAHEPAYFAAWAAGLSGSLRESGGIWTADTPAGSATVRFTPPNAHGVLDHWVRPKDAPEVYVPLRMLAHGPGTEVELVLFRQPGMSDADFERDAGLVEKDLGTLKRLLEQAA